MKNFSSHDNELVYIYALTPRGTAEKAAVTHHFLKRKMDVHEALKAKIDAIRAEVEESGGEEVLQACLTLPPLVLCASSGTRL